MDEEEARSGVAAGRQLRTRLTLLKGNTPRGRTPRAQEGGRCSLRTSVEGSRPRFQPWTPLSVTAPTGGMHEHSFVESIPSSLIWYTCGSFTPPQATAPPKVASGTLADCIR